MEPGFGEKGRRSMRGKTDYRKAPRALAEAILGAEVIEDFLPPPAGLVFKDDTVKITLSLSTRSVRFFKQKAHENRVPYQAMIQQILDLYARHYGRT